MIINPTTSDVELQKGIDAYYRHLSNLILESMWCMTASTRAIKDKISYQNHEVIDQIEQEGKPVTILLSHIGNWELYCQWVALYFPQFQFNILYTPIKNKAINDILVTYRERFGVKLISTKSTLDLFRSQKQNNIVCNMFAIDQNPGDPYHQYWTSFFGVEVPVISGAEKFAISQHQSVYYLDIEWNDDRYYLNLEKINFDTTINHDITNKQLIKLEQNIKKAPFLWLLSHNRFKYSK